MSEVAGKFPNPFEGMNQDEIDAYMERVNQADRQRQEAALARLPEFTGEDRDQKVIAAHTFMAGLVMRLGDIGRGYSIEAMALPKIMEDLQTAYPDVLTYDITTKIWNALKSSPTQAI